jgi:hypothetical protein
MASKVYRVHNWWCSFNCSVADPDLNRSMCFWASWIRIRIHYSEVWIRIQIRIWILLTLSKHSQKTFDFYIFVTSFYRIVRNYDVATSYYEITSIATL